MTGSGPAAQFAEPAVAELVQRVGSGVQVVVAEGWAEPRSGFGRHFLNDESRANWWRLATSLLSGGSTAPQSDVTTLVTALTARLAADRGLLLTAAYHPRIWMAHLVAVPSAVPLPPHVTWACWCWAAQALWDASVGATSAAVETDQEFARPLAARLRFLVLSEAFRHRGERRSDWLPAEDRDVPGDAPFAVVFGGDSWHLLVGRARQARWTWQAHLNSYQSHPSLAGASVPQIEQELDALLFCRGSGGAALHITGATLEAPDAAGADDLAVQADAIERHLLPRFRLRQVIALAYRSSASPARLAPVGRGLDSRPRHALAGFDPRQSLAATAALLLGCTALGLAMAGPFTAAAWTAAGCYVAVVVGTLTGGPLFAAPWMLRWPAAASLGLLALTAFDPHWWRAAAAPTLTPGPTWAPAVLTLAAYGYLVSAVGNRGMPGPRALGRALVVLAAGLWHASLVSLLGLVAVLPAFAASGDSLANLLAGPHHGRALLVLATATCWCLAAGVFSQILWDDRPITAPLTHTGWRSGRDV